MSIGSGGEKNNEAVKQSRIKSKAKTAEIQDQVNVLMQENQLLNLKVASLTKEFELLKDLYQAHAKYTPSSEPVQEIDLRTLMALDDLSTQHPTDTFLSSISVRCCCSVQTADT